MSKLSKIAKYYVLKGTELKLIAICGENNYLLHASEAFKNHEKN